VTATCCSGCQERNELQIHVSLITLDAPLARKLEARSPHPIARLRRSRSSWMPASTRGSSSHRSLPGITDDIARLDALFAARKSGGVVRARRARCALRRGARSLSGVLEEHFPALVPRYIKALRAAGGRRKSTHKHCHDASKNYGADMASKIIGADRPVPSGEHARARRARAAG